LKSLKNFIDETDRKIEVYKKKLAEKQKDISEEIEDKANGVHDINEKIGTLLEEAEKLGGEGEVEKSQEIMKEVEALKEEKRNAEQSYRNSMPSSLLQQQRLRVCEICSSYLENFDGLHDNDKRLADHYGGKLHLGFIDLRDRLAELEKYCKDNQEEYDKVKQKSRSRSRERRNSDYDRNHRRDERSRDTDRSRDSDRSRDYRDRERRHRRHRSRSRSRDKYRSRDRRRR
jgi:RNA-binding protein Luc7-like 2